MIKKCFLSLFIFLVCLIGIDKVYASASYTLVNYDADFPYLYGVYCAYGAVKTDGSLVYNDNGSPKEFYYILYTGSNMDTLFEFDVDLNQQIESDLGIAIEAGSPGKTLSDSNQINWLKEKGFVSSDGKWSCPDLDDSSDKNGDGYTKYKAFTKDDNSGSVCKAADGGCLVSSIPETEPINYTCTYKGQKSGKTLTIKVYENEEEKVIKKVTYPDGSVVEEKFNGMILDEDCSEDIYYVYDKKSIHFTVDTNDKVSNNAALSSLCRNYDESKFEHFCSGTCKYKEMKCPSKGSSSSGSSFSSDECNGLLPIVRFIRKGVLSIIQIGIPILLIIMGTIDLAKAVMSSDDKEIKGATSKFVKRAIAAIAVFFVVTFVTLIMDLIADNTNDENEKANKDWRDCWDAAK